MMQPIQQRNIALCIVLTVITCGIYGIYWFICLNDDINNVSGEQGPSGGLAFLFSLISCSIYMFYWSYKNGEKLNTAYTKRGMPVDSSMGVIYLVLSIFGLSIVAWALMQNELNKLSAMNAPQA